MQKKYSITRTATTPGSMVEDRQDHLFTSDSYEEAKAKFEALKPEADEYCTDWRLDVNLTLWENFPDINLEEYFVDYEENEETEE